ncbi:MAG: acyltransferase [Ilumatobacteraceae bacterium]
MSTIAPARTGSAPFHMPSLDGIRAVSIMIVFIAHVGFNSLVPAQFGVTVFFFLSGYLITTLLRREFEKTDRIGLGHFYLRRVLRILPPFYAVLVLAIVLSELLVTPTTTEPESVWAVSFHWANYYIVEHGERGFVPGTGVYWSLAVEEHFYLLFPLVFILMHRLGLTPRRMAAVMLGLCALVLAWRVNLWMTTDVVDPFQRLAVATDTRFDSLLFGCVLAVLGNPALDLSRWTEKVWKYVLFPAAAAGLILTFVVDSEAFKQTFRYSVQGICLIPIFVCAVRYPTWWVMRPLNWRPMAFLGLLSYSLYLCHLIVLAAITEQVPGISRPALAVVGFAASVGVSWGIYQVIERPCLRLRRRLSA